MTDYPGVPAVGKGGGPQAGGVLTRAYDNAQRMVDRDAEILDQLRTRASTLLAALAIGGAILGAVLSSATHPAVPWWVVAPLVLAVVLCVLVLWSTRDYGRLTEPVPGRRPRRRPARRGADARVAQEIGQVRTSAREFVKTATRFRDEADAAITELDLLSAAAQATGEAVTTRLDIVIAQARARAEQAIGRVRTGAHDLVAAARNILVAADAAVAELERLRAAGQATEAPARAIGHTRVAAGALLVAATRTRDRAVAELGPDLDAGQTAEARADAARRAIRRARYTMRALDSAAARTREHADTAAVALEHPRWRLARRWLATLPERPRRGWRHAWTPWLEWFGALVEGDQRLWKVGLNQQDLIAARRYARRRIRRSQREAGGSPPPPAGATEADLVDSYLIRRLYVAHSRNDGTINRRADLLRFAAGFASVFVLALGIWLATMTPATGQAAPSSGSTTAPTIPPPTEPGPG